MKVLKELRTAGNRLRYCLTEETREDGTFCYGVSVSTVLFGDEERAEVKDISSDFRKVERFMDILADNSVLPSTLCEVAEEYISAEYTL